ncbi:hypothetical protein GCM10020367_39930 [Streptomyces sannanensis]|uniref:Uncharacterized protein n=1 Tax=Streptomyces sannanensis TaxID=285536 RepID=A0ABP6SF15_9ACTN
MGKPLGKGSDTAGARAKNHSPIRRDSTKKPKPLRGCRTETLTTPQGYCALEEPGVPWCDKGLPLSSEPRITLRVGKLTIGDGSKGRVGSP